MIPKIIHFCWLSGDPYPANIERCIESWKLKLPDYEFMLWNLERSDINSSVWLQESFAHKKYAFAADYIRFYALYHYGGIYLDSDVEVLKNFDDLLHLPYFIGFDSHNSLEAAVLGCTKGNPWIKMCLDYYDHRHFLLPDGRLDTKPLPGIMKGIIEKKYSIVPLENSSPLYVLDENLYVHSYMFFSPKRHDTGNISLKHYTYTIHHYAMSWIPLKYRLIVKIKRVFMLILGVNFVDSLIEILYLRKIKDNIISKK